MKTQLNRILLISEQPLVRDGIKYLLQDIKNITMVGETSFSKVNELMKRVEADAIIIHLSKYDITKVIYIRLILQHFRKLRVLVITEITNHAILRYLFEIGIFCCLTMNSSHEEIRKAVDIVLNNQKYISTSVENNLIQDQNSSLNLLSHRELEVFILRISGLDIDAISRTLFLSKKTIFTYHYMTLKKLSLKNEIELIQLASRERILPLIDISELKIK